jgi:hypothetical protein
MSREEQQNVFADRIAEFILDGHARPDVPESMCEIQEVDGPDVVELGRECVVKAVTAEHLYRHYDARAAQSIAEAASLHL